MRRSFIAALALLLAVAACGGGGTTPPANSGQSSQPASSPRSMSTSPGPATGSATSAASVSAPPAGASGPASASSATPSATTSKGYVPLWPFASVAEAARWQREAGQKGHQPWHLDAGAVAAAFGQQYLTFTGVDRVIARKVTANEAHITLGLTVEGAEAGTAAVVHLVRFGSGAGRPWEVVGTDDTADFSLTTPLYGSTAAGAITVGGRITGVDESIRVTARQLSGPVGSFCCRSAGDTGPWSVPLRLTHTNAGPITIVASTGGHVADVERFTVTGVRSR